MIAHDHYDMLLKLELSDAGFSSSQIRAIWDEAPPEVLQICGAFFATAIAQGNSVREILSYRNIMHREGLRAQSNDNETVSMVGEALLRLNDVLQDVARYK